MGASVGGSGGGWDNEDGGFTPVSEINVTPLVDVMLVLLIVFMVAAPLMTVGVPLQLPKSAAAKSTEPKDPMVVSIDKDGKVYLAEEELPDDQILARLTTLAGEDKEQIVLVRGDKEIQYGRLMEIMGHVSNAGFLKVSLIAEMAPKGATAAPDPAAPGAPTPAADSSSAPTASPATALGIPLSPPPAPPTSAPAAPAPAGPSPAAPAPAQ